MASESDTEDNVRAKAPNIQDRLDFPTWYGLATWWAPLGVALMVGVITALLLTNMVALPAMLSTFAGAPAFIASLEGIAASAALIVSVSAAAALTYFSSLFVARGLTSSLVEEIARNNQREYALVQRKLMSKKIKLDGREEVHQHALVLADQETQKITTKYDKLRGFIAANDGKKASKKPSLQHKENKNSHNNKKLSHKHDKPLKKPRSKNIVEKPNEEPALNPSSSPKRKPN